MKQTKHRSKLVLMAFLATMSISGCKISQNTAGPSQGIVKESISINTKSDFDLLSERVLRRMNYTIYRREANTEFMIETDWKLRLPTELEVDRGISDVRNKIILRGRPYMRGEYTVNEMLYSITFEGITEYRKVATNEWIILDLDESGRKIMKDEAFELKSEMAGRQ